MRVKESPLFVTLRWFDDDWNPIDELEMRNVPFHQGVKIMHDFRENVEGDCSPLALTEEIGRPVAFVTGEVTLGEI